MRKPLDIVGQRFFKLVVLEYIGGSNGDPSFLCKCDCGEKKVILLGSLMSGNTRSCGCWRMGLNTSNPRLRATWGNMKSRCNNPNDTRFKNYGGRGIRVCDEWNNSSESFGEWALSNGYSKELTIDRIDNNGNYSPENCKWATMLEQSRNKRNNTVTTINGITKILKDWANYWGLPPSVVSDRYRRGDRGDRLMRPVAKKILNIS